MSSLLIGSAGSERVGLKTILPDVERDALPNGLRERVGPGKTRRFQISSLRRSSS